MLWIFYALLAHVANGTVFIVDKSLLGGKSVLQKPLTYALYSAALAGLVVVLLPFANVVTSSFVLTWSLVAGGVHILALFVFFTAMRLGEPSRIVPITGSAVPLFTVLFAVFFLGEVFTLWQVVGIGLLIIGGGLLSLRQGSRFLPLVRGGARGGNLLLPLFAGLLFAGYFVVTKHIYTYANDAFLSVFMTTRIIEALLAIIGIAIMNRVPLSQFWERVRVRAAKRRSLPSSAIRLASLAHGTFSPIGEKGAPVLFISNKLLAAGAFLLQTYAISLGSVSVVNALQGVQFAFVFLLAIIFSHAFPNIFREEVGRGVLVQKGVGILFVSIGVMLIV